MVQALRGCVSEQLPGLKNAYSCVFIICCKEEIEEKPQNNTLHYVIHQEKSLPEK